MNVSDWSDLHWKELKAALVRRGLFATVGEERLRRKADKREHDNLAIVALGNWERQ